MRKKRKRFYKEVPRAPSPWEKAKARRLADKYNLPVSVTLRIIRGELELSQALEEKKARKLYEELVASGMDPNIAGQVARGRLSREAGEVRSNLLKAQGRSFYFSRLNAYQRGDRVSLYLFDHGLFTGIIVDKAPYDLDIVPDNEDIPVLVKKHDVKFHADPEDMERILQRLQRDEDVAAQGLSSTVDLNERLRPTHEDALIWVSVGAPLKFTFRDGDTLVGRVKACGIYEIEVLLEEGLSVFIMTHALHKDFPPVFVNG